MRKTPPAKTAAAEAPTLDLFSAPAPPPRPAAAQATRPKAAPAAAPPAKAMSVQTPRARAVSAPAAVPGKRVPPKPTASPSAPSKPAPSKPAPAAAKPAPPKLLPAKTAKTAKTISVRDVSAPPAPVRVVAETPATYFLGAGGRAWRMSGKHAVAYVRDASVAGELLATEPRHLAKSAMAVYYDRKGKPFAWQLRFDTARWEEVIGRLG